MSILALHKLDFYYIFQEKIPQAYSAVYNIFSSPKSYYTTLFMYNIDQLTTDFQIKYFKKSASLYPSYLLYSCTKIILANS